MGVHIFLRKIFPILKLVLKLREYQCIFSALLNIKHEPLTPQRRLPVIESILSQN